MASLSTAVTVLNRSVSSIIARRSIATFSTASAQYYGLIDSRRTGAAHNKPKTTSHISMVNSRPFSSLPPTDNVNGSWHYPPPTSLTVDAALKAQDAMRLFIEHGIGRKALDGIADETRQGNVPLIDRWQKIIQVYLQTQIAVIQLLGYAPNEHGITLYTQHLSQAKAMSSPEVQETLRTASRDTYRMVLGGAFGLDLVTEQNEKGEMSIVDARNMMYKVSLRMQDPAVLEKVAKATSQAVGMNDSPEAESIELANKNTTIQKIVLHDVYLAGSPSLVEECGFGGGEEGYIRMQGSLAEYQDDPLIHQYVGGATVKLLESAGIDMNSLKALAGAS